MMPVLRPARLRALRLAALHSLAAVLCLTACRSETTPSEGARKGVSQPTSAAAASPSEAPAATSPATQAAQPLPPDPGGCLTTGCHQDLVRVTYRHGPLSSGTCDACHEAEQSGHKFPLKRPGSETCTFCHQVTGHRQHVHAVVEKVGCLPCHNPHGSDTKFLQRAASTELTCRQCHDIQRKAYLHGPFAAGECTACHQPHESDHAKLLFGNEGTNPCLLCHKGTQQKLQAAGTLHAPVKESCTHCHAAHSSDQPHLLTAPMEELCFACHPDVEGQVAKASSPHGAVFTGDRCANCHDPHAEGRPFLLRDEMANLCLRCHNRPQQATDGRTIPDMRPVLRDRKFLHGPVRTGQCNACHEVHGSSNARLLRQYFPPQFYAAFDLANYALCFGCHSQSIVLEQQTSSLTNFRDQDRNLHFLHVNRTDKGRSCRTCHEIHGSNLPRHMASEVPFEGGGWSMPIRFEPTPTGGRCSPGCHETREYRRIPTAPAPTRAGTRPAQERVSP
jgi:predicted CXXCH cytochrome family protein